MKNFSYTTIILASWIFLLLSGSVIGAVEGNLFPVLTEFKYSVTEIDSETILKGTFKKIRKCNYIATYVYIKDSDGNSRTMNISDRVINVRGIGLHLYGPWKTGVENLLSSNLSGTIYTKHNCHPLWQTKTTLLTF